MPSYNIHITANTIDTDHDALLEVVERVAAALRPALPYGTAIEATHVHRDLDDTETTPSVWVEPGATIELADGHAVRPVRVVAVTEATDEQPARLTVQGYGTQSLADALTARDAR